MSLFIFTRTTRNNFMETVYEVALKAINRNEISLLLLGEGGYNLPKPYMSPTDLPTDWDAILKDGIYRIYFDDNKKVNGGILSETLIGMCVDEKGIYCALNVFFRMLIHKKNGIIPFDIDIDAIVRSLSLALKANKDMFCMDKRWMGATEECGLWGEVLRIRKIIFEDFGLTIF